MERDYAIDSGANARVAKLELWFVLDLGNRVWPTGMRKLSEGGYWIDSAVFGPTSREVVQKSSSGKFAISVWSVQKGPKDWALRFDGKGPGLFIHESRKLPKVLS
jgi:hypothetical protein